MGFLTVPLTIIGIVAAIIVLSGIYGPILAYTSSYVLHYLSGLKMPTWNPGS